ncbi:MAG TPA: hypothetical protein VGG76_09460 [Gemmatimonadaceae bacterium]
MSLRHPINPSDNRLARPRLRWKAALFTAIAVLAPAAGFAQAPNACANDPERHRFDFWIGEWNVTTKGGTPVGGSVIQSVSGGCAILENWTSLKGGQGKSLNGYNPLLHQWQQFWIGGDGSVSEYRASELDGSSLVFLMRARPDADSVARLTFTPLDSATVRQHSEQSSDGGKSWVTQYDFYYHRRPGSR